MADCNCDQCQRARKLVVFARDVLEFELAPWQEAVMLNLAKCSRAAIADGWLNAAIKAAQRRISQTPPWARPVVLTGKSAGRR